MLSSFLFSTSTTDCRWDRAGCRSARLCVTRAVSSLVAGGCIVSGSKVRHSLLSTGVHVHSYGLLEGAVVLPYAKIGRGARLRNVVIDGGVTIPDGLVVGEDPELDALRFRRTDRGVCLITQPMIDRLGG